MKLSLKSLTTVSVLASALALTACDQTAKETTSAAPAATVKPLRVGVIAGAEEQVAEVAAKVAKEEYNLDVELVSLVTM